MPHHALSATSVIIIQNLSALFVCCLLKASYTLCKTALNYWFIRIFIVSGHFIFIPPMYHFANSNFFTTSTTVILPTYYFICLLHYLILFHPPVSPVAYRTKLHLSILHTAKPYPCISPKTYVILNKTVSLYLQLGKTELLFIFNSHLSHIQFCFWTSFSSLNTSFHFMFWPNEAILRLYTHLLS